MNTEERAKKLYTAYCKGVGGLSYNGDTLPTAEELFADESKQKITQGWINAAIVHANTREPVETAHSDLEEMKDGVLELLEDINHSLSIQDWDSASENIARLNAGVIALAVYEHIFPKKK